MKLVIILPAYVCPSSKRARVSLVVLSISTYFPGLFIQTPTSPRHLSSHPCSNVSTNVLLLCHHCQCNLVVASSHPFASTNISSSFPAFHLLPVHCNSGVFLSRIFSLAPTFSFPFHLPPLQLGDCFVSHRFARSDIPPSPAQPSTTPTAVLDRFIA